MNINWNYKDPYDPHPEEIARKRTGWRWPIFMTTKGN
jgi:hypothetical protein